MAGFGYFAFEVIVDRRIKKTEEQAITASCHESAWQRALRVARKENIINIRRISREEYDAITASTPADRVGYYQPGWHTSTNYSFQVKNVRLWPNPADTWARHRRISQQEYDKTVTFTQADVDRYCRTDSRADTGQ